MLFPVPCWNVVNIDTVLPEQSSSGRPTECTRLQPASRTPQLSAWTIQTQGREGNEYQVEQSDHARCSLAQECGNLFSPTTR